MFATDDCKSGNCFFLNGLGGSEKTFVYNSLISALSGRNEIVIPVASTGIAATLLAEGQCVSNSKNKINESNTSFLSYRF